MEEHTDKQNLHVLLVGIASILLIGVVFIGKSFFVDDTSDIPSSATNSSTSTKAERQTITPQELQAKINRKENVFLVDIRSKEDYIAKHLPKSRSFPSETMNNFSKEGDALVIIIGSIKNPDANELALSILKEKNIENWFLAGGFEEWSQKGYPTISQGNPSDFVDQSKVTFITKENLLPLVGDNSVLILDTQSDDNYHRKHIKGALHITLNDLEKKANEIPSNKRVVVYGENELESFRAGVRLFDLNFFSVETLRGNDHLKTGSSLPLEP